VQKPNKQSIYEQVDEQSTEQLEFNLRRIGANKLIYHPAQKVFFFLTQA